MSVLAVRLRALSQLMVLTEDLAPAIGGKLATGDVVLKVLGLRLLPLRLLGRPPSVVFTTTKLVELPTDGGWHQPEQ
jgi:hypothetical protein